MDEEKEYYSIGYTYNTGHLTPRPVQNVPEYVIESSKELIGKVTRRLL